MMRILCVIFLVLSLGYLIRADEVGRVARSFPRHRNFELLFLDEKGTSGGARAIGQSEIDARSAAHSENVRKARPFL